MSSLSSDWKRKEKKRKTLCLPRKTTSVNNPLENDIEAAPLHKICKAEPWKWLKEKPRHRVNRHGGDPKTSTLQQKINVWGDKGTEPLSHYPLLSIEAVIFHLQKLGISREGCEGLHIVP
jgi:hypothetical protein